MTSDLDTKTQNEAKLEIDKSFFLAFFCVRQFGLTFEPTKNPYHYTREKLMVIITFVTICYHVFSELVYIGLVLSHEPKVETVVPLLHTFGYGFLSIFKLFAIWSKRDQFKQLLRDLVEIWPVPPLDVMVKRTKDRSLKALRFVHLCTGYFVVNIGGVWFYNISPIVMYLYRRMQGINAEIGFVWTSWYPFDKYSLHGHILAYLFEMFAGVTCVWAMIGSDLLFAGMASHIGMLLRLLHRRLEDLAPETSTVDHEDCYRKLVDCIKLHQRLIEYCNELEKTFTLVNLVNIIMSSISICCVVFVIVLLEPFIFVSNKLFLMSALIQIGLICWYSDDIYHANGDVATHAYNSGWYRTNPKWKRALLFLIKRNAVKWIARRIARSPPNICFVWDEASATSQKPIAFTAMNFTNINLTTYSAILTKSYSYFALLYTMYRDDKGNSDQVTSE